MKLKIKMNINDNLLTTRGNDLATFLARKSSNLQDTSFLKSWSAKSWPVCQHRSDETIVPDPLSSIPTHTTIFALGMAVNVTKRKRCKRPCVYYANTTATFRVLLEGDLVFKLNLGPGSTIRQINPIVRTCYRPQRMLQTRSRNSANLVNIRCGPFLINVNHSLSLRLMNTQSVRNKTADFVDYVCGQALHLVAVTDTWLKTIDDAIRVELCPAGYNLIDYPRTRRCGGGIGLLYKDSLRVTKVRNGEKESFKLCELLVQISSSLKIRVVIVYRPPHSEDHRIPVVTFLSEFSSYMESIILSKDHLLILGDFNIHMDVSTDAYTVKFMDLLESLGLEQHVRGPTHTHAHTLDLVITRKMENIIARPPRVCRYFSDHATVHCDMNFNKPAFQVKKISYRKVKAVDMDCLKGDLALLDLYNGPTTMRV